MQAPAVRSSYLRQVISDACHRHTSRGVRIVEEGCARGLLQGLLWSPDLVSLMQIEDEDIFRLNALLLHSRRGDEDVFTARREGRIASQARFRGEKRRFWPYSRLIEMPPPVPVTHPSE